jgi:hypothetical protein
VRARLLLTLLATSSALVFVGSASADHPGMGGTPLFATLTGANEVPLPGHPTATGTASLRLNSGQEEICGRITTVGLEALTISGAHIHPGAAGQAGGVLVPLNELVNHPTGTCVDAPRAVIKRIRKNPANFYVNVHALPGFGPGAIRGQLERGRG